MEVIDLSRRAKVFGNLALDRQADLIRVLRLGDFAEFVSQMDAEDRADLYKRLPQPEQQELMRKLAQEGRDNISRLSAHPEGCADAIMTADYATLEVEMTTAEAIAALRCLGAGVEAIYRFYGLNGRRCLIGSVRLHELILVDADTLISDLMDKARISVAMGAKREDVVKTIAHYEYLAVPVNDADGRLAGKGVLDAGHDCSSGDIVVACSFQDCEEIPEGLGVLMRLHCPGRQAVQQKKSEMICMYQHALKFRCVRCVRQFRRRNFNANGRV